MENLKRKIRVGFVSNLPTAGKTGLARNMKSLLPILYKTGKYEIFFLAQGMSDNSPEFSKLPFKCEGVFKNFDQNRFNNPNEEGYRRIVSYGGTAIESFVLNNQLDVLILSDDMWAFPNDLYLNADWFKYMQKNILPIITADSEPIMPQIKEWAEKCENMSFWTNFAGRVLKQESEKKYGHCKTIPAALNTNDFKPISETEKLSLRRQFNIGDDEKVILYLGRNQLRKIFGANIKALAKFKKLNPNKKVRLLFHCSWSEPHGWPLNQIREQCGLSQEDILTTYYCQKCSHWHILPFIGEGVNCPACNSEKSMITAGVGSNINEQDLNKIYNICDGSSSVFTSGAFELTNAESILAGLPLACPNYSCGEDFCSNDFVYEIKGTRTWEHNSGFEKFVPDINSIVNFFEYVYDLPLVKKQKITEKARQWAVDNFDKNNVVKKYESFLDSRELIDWDIFNKKRAEVKNLNPQIQHKDNNDEFVLECYKKILNMEPDKDDSGRKHWNQFLSQPGDQNKLRNSMINSMLGAAQEHNAKNSKRTSLEDILDQSGRKRIGITMPESIGDIYLTSSILDSVRKRYPSKDWALHFITKPEYFSILDCNPNIDKLIPYSPEFDNLLLMEGTGKNKGFFDILYQPHFGTQRLLDWTHNSLDIHDLDFSN